MGFQIAIDTGGTFTDSILVDNKGQYIIGKVPTTIDDTSRGIMESLRLAAQRAGGLTLPEFLANCDVIMIGTTVAYNILVQHKGAKCGMITTKGFRDILEFRRIPKQDVFNLKLPRPRILIPRYLRFVVDERITVTGEVLTPLNEDEGREAARKARAHNCEVVVVCFLHSYINNEHEKKMAQIIREEYPETEVLLSSDVLPRPIEFDRFNTTALAAYTGPTSISFVKGLEKQLREANYQGAMLFTTSAAGAATAEDIIRRPIQLLSSGPAGGVLSASFLGKLSGTENVISMDMGGTSLDVSVLPRGMILTTNESIIEDQMNAAEIVDVRSIGAGGGSIAWLDQRGILCVGPESAGAEPGPACYGKGGIRPTVTDADVVLGYIPADYFLGGEIRLDKSLAEKVIKEQIADPLGVDVIKAALSIRAVVDGTMADQLMLTSVSLGYDPRNFVMCVGGGAGPVHAFAIAIHLGIKDIYIPKIASAFCAFGMLTSADYRYEFSRVLPRLETQLDLSEVNAVYQSMEAEGVALVRRIKGLDTGAIKVRRGADMRYFGQVYDMEATIPETAPGKTVTKDDVKALIANFHDRHEEIYGYAERTMGTSITRLKLVARGERPPLKLAEQPASSEDPSGALKRRRSIFSEESGDFVETPCYDGDKLRHGNIITGPAVIEEKTTTIVIPAKARVIVDRYGNYVGKL